MNRRSDTPREGTKLAWLAQHLDWTVEQLLADGPFKDDNEALKRARYMLRRKYGAKNVPAKPSGNRSKASRWGQAKKSTTKRTAKKTQTKKRAAKKTTTHSPAIELKLGQLRKLVFELGWDLAREVFEEFQQTHNRW